MQIGDNLNEMSNLFSGGMGAGKWKKCKMTSAEIFIQSAKRL